MPAPPLLDAAGRIALVTGAAGGIGRAVVGLMQACGARVVGFDRSPCPGDLAVAGDATSEDDVQALVARVLDAYGRLDFVVHAVGAVGSGPVAAQSAHQWRQLLDLNLGSAFLLARGVHSALARSRGALVLVSSTNGRNGGSAVSGAAYATAKAGVANLARYLAKEWAPDGIRVNYLSPGPVRTPMLDRLSPEQDRQLRQSIPLGRYASAEEVAAAAGFLCSRHAASMTGACLNISGGLVLD